MKAMVLAAGIGQRLRPLTDQTPKALVDVGGMPMLEIVIRRLIHAGVDSIVINVFHLADKVEAYLKERRNFGIHIELSRERELLDTGGGLKKAAFFFKDSRPFFLHNVDVLSNVDLQEMFQDHKAQGSLATLAVSDRESTRYLLFDAQGLLRGWESVADSRKQWAGAPVEKPQRLAFNGIHVIDPAIFSKMTETGVFSITQAYLRLAGQGEKVRAFRCDSCYCQDIGGPAKLEDVRQYVKRSGIPV